MSAKETSLLIRLPMVLKTHYCAPMIVKWTDGRKGGWWKKKVGKPAEKEQNERKTSSPEKY